MTEELWTWSQPTVIVRHNFQLTVLLVLFCFVSWVYGKHMLEMKIGWDENVCNGSIIVFIVFVITLAPKWNEAMHPKYLYCLQIVWGYIENNESVSTENVYTPSVLYDCHLFRALQLKQTCWQHRKGYS